MKQFTQKVVYAGVGIVTGLGGLMAAANCQGAGCSSCYGCMGGGILIAAVATVDRIKKRRQQGAGYGMAEVDH